MKDKWALKVDNGGNKIINSLNHLFESSQLFLIDNFLEGLLVSSQWKFEAITGL